MSAESTRLRRWLTRSRPPRADLARAFVAGLVATITNVALFVGAVGLLVVSSDRPGLRAVAGVLIVIEMFAFLRSPIRFAERLSGHRLGLAAVTQWRRWVMTSVGGWSYSRWRRYASGDLLERALHDTDELLDLWLRGLLPLATAVATLAVGDVVLGSLPAAGSFWLDAALLAVLQGLCVAVLVARVPALIAADRAVRRARADYQSTLVELSAAAPELFLLGAAALVDARSYVPVAAMRHAERGRRRRRVGSGLVPVVAALASLGVLAWHHPPTSPVWTIVATLLALAAYELLGVVREALDTFVAVSAAVERLEELEGPTPGGAVTWSDDVTISANALTLSEGEVTLARDVSLIVPPGRRVAVTGASGTGKSALLRALAALDEPQGGVVLVGGLSIADVDEDDLRRHLAYVASEPGLLIGLVGDVMSAGRRLSRDAVADLARVGIRAGATTRWDELSRGERQRAAVVRALCVSPAIVLLDEPTSGLGRDETTMVLELLNDVGPSVIVATHDPVVMAWCDEVVELREGALINLSR